MILYIYCCPLYTNSSYELIHNTFNHACYVRMCNYQHHHSSSSNVIRMTSGDNQYTCSKSPSFQDNESASQDTMHTFNTTTCYFELTSIYIYIYIYISMCMSYVHIYCSYVYACVCALASLLYLPLSLSRSTLSLSLSLCVCV